MRAFFWMLVLSGCLLTLATKAQETTQTVVVRNLDKKKGDVYIGWYNSQESYMDANKAVYKKVVPVTGKNEVAVAFDNIPSGTYAITVFFDSNGNGELDKNLLGIPREEYGFSNNIIPLTRSATFQEASISVNGRPQSIIIGIK